MDKQRGGKDGGSGRKGGWGEGSHFDNNNIIVFFLVTLTQEQLDIVLIQYVSIWLLLDSLV